MFRGVVVQGALYAAMMASLGLLVSAQPLKGAEDGISDD